MLKKLLTYTLAVSTVMWSVGFLATPLAVGAASSGDLIKLQCSAGAGVSDPCKAVYYLGADGKRYVFPNQKTYNTWYSDFSGVMTISSTEMSAYPIGGNVTYRPGVKMVKITTDPKVYAVGANGSLHWVTTGDIAEALYGANWNQMIEDVPDAFFVNYTIGSDINNAGDYSSSDQMDAAPTINDDKNLSSSGTPGGNVSTGTSLTVSLAADTPASGVVLGNTINNKFTKVNLTASADGDIVIDQIKVKRTGLGQNAAFSGIVLLDAATDTRIDDPKTLNSSDMATFNDDITVPAGTTKSIYIAGNMSAPGGGLYAGETPSLSLYQVTLAGSANVIGSLPITGNTQHINGTITVGALTVKDGGDNPDAQTQKIGTTDYVVSGITLTANGVEDFHVNQITWDNGGSISSSDVENLDLVVDGVVRATLSSMTGDKATFNLNPPLLIEEGKNIDVALRLDILDGSNRTIRFDIEDESDIRAVGQTYNAEVKVGDGGAGAVTDATPFWTAPVTTVDVGSLRIGPATLTAANIADDQDDVVLGKFEFEAKGEAIEITSLPIVFTVTTSSGDLSTDSTVDITNVVLEDENGNVLAGPLDGVDKTNTSNSAQMVAATSTDTITVPAGTHIFTVKADLDSDFGTDDTIVARINPAQVTAKGDTTGITVTPTPSSDQSSATMTVQAAALAVSLSPQPVAQTVVAGTKGHTFANVVLGAQSSGEDIRVTQLKVAVKCNSTCNPAEVSNFSIFDGATELTTSNDPDSQTAGKTTDDQDATSTFTFTTPLVIAQGTQKTLTIKGDISNSATNGAMTVGLPDSTSGAHITAKGDDTNLSAAITLSVSEGQAQTFSSVGTLTITQDTSSPKNGLMPANSNGLTFAVFSVTAQNEAVNIEKMYLTAVAANSGGLDQINKVYIYNGATLLAEVTPTSTDGTDRTVLVDVTNSPISVPKDSNIKLTLKVDTAGSDATIGTTGASGQGLSLKVNAAGDITAKGAQSGTAVASKTITNATSNTLYLFRSVPTVATNDLLTSGKVSSGTLTSGTESTKDLYAFSVTANSSGDIALHRVSFLLSTSIATVTNLKITDGTEDVALQESGNFGFVGVSGSGYAGGSGWLGQGVFFFVDNNTAPSTSTGSNIVPHTIAAGTTDTFTLKGDVQCANTCSGSDGTGSVNIQFLGDTALAATTPFSALTDASIQENLQGNGFVWTDFYQTSLVGASDSAASSSSQFSNGAFVALTNGGTMVSTSSAVTFSK